MPIVFAMPSAGAIVAPDPWLGAPMTWVGADGSLWDLARNDTVVRMQRGVKGLHTPRFDMHQSSTPLVPGNDVSGYSLPARTVYWPLLFFAGSSEEWLSTYSAFMRSLHPLTPGTWTVGEGDSARSLDLTYRNDGSYAFTSDPVSTGIALIGFELEASRPLWRGRPVSKTFFADEPVDFIPDDDGDEYHPSAVASFASATIANPGNEPAYLRWTVQGPQDELQLGIGGAVIEVPFALADGSTLVIDTDPAGQYATLDGVDCTAALGFQMFAPVPARGTSPLTIQSAGAGSVTATLVPLYWTFA